MFITKADVFLCAAFFVLGMNCPARYFALFRFFEYIYCMQQKPGCVLAERAAALGAVFICSEFALQALV